MLCFFYNCWCWLHVAHLQNPMFGMPLLAQGVHAHLPLHVPRLSSVFILCYVLSILCSCCLRLSCGLVEPCANITNTENYIAGGLRNVLKMVKWYALCVQDVGRFENIVGWYHSHPGYGCWLSGIDCSTQMLNQQYQVRTAQPTI